jgi:predicted small lipoprotein YifL
MRRTLLLTLIALALILGMAGCGAKAPTTSNDDPQNDPGSKFEQLGTATDAGQ